MSQVEFRESVFGIENLVRMRKPDAGHFVFVVSYCEGLRRVGDGNVTRFAFAAGIAAAFSDDSRVFGDMGSSPNDTLGRLVFPQSLK